MIGALNSDDPRATWAVVAFQGITPPPEGQRWAITASYGVSYWASEAEAEAYAASERVRGAHRGVACVVVRIAAVTGHVEVGNATSEPPRARVAFEDIVHAAASALEQGRTRVV